MSLAELDSIEKKYSNAVLDPIRCAVGDFVWTRQHANERTYFCQIDALVKKILKTMPDLTVHEQEEILTYGSLFVVHRCK